MLIEPKPISTSSGGASAFVDLTDVPASYSGQALKAARVNAGATGLEFYAPTDTPFAMAADWVNVLDYGAAGVVTTTTLAAQLNAGAISATLTSASSFAIGHGMAIPGAGVAGAEIVVTLTGVSGNIVSWASPATTTTVAAGATVYHDDTVAIKAAYATGKNVYLPSGNYVVFGGSQTGFQITQNGQIISGPRHEAITSARGAIIWSRSTTQDVFLVTADYGEISNLFITQNSTITPTAGAAIVLGQRAATYGASLLANRFNVIEVTISNIYDGFRTEFATNCFIEKVLVANPRRYGFHFNSPAPTGGCWFKDCQAYLGSPSWASGVVAGYYFENLDTTQLEGMRAIGFKTNIYYNASNNLPGYTWLSGSPGCFQNIWTHLSSEVPADSTNFMIRLEGSYVIERAKFTGAEFESVYVGSNCRDVGFTGFTIPWAANGKCFEVYGKGTHIGSGNITMYTGVTNYFGIKIGAAAVGTRVNNVRVVGFNEASISGITALEILNGATRTIIGDCDFSNGTVTIGTTAAEEMTIRNNSRFHNNIGLNSYGSSVSYTPGWVGQEALVGTIFYRAAGISSTADWKALN